MRYLILIAISVFLSACGGGSDNQKTSTTDLNPSFDEVYDGFESFKVTATDPTGRCLHYRLESGGYRQAYSPEESQTSPDFVLEGSVTFTAEGYEFTLKNDSNEIRGVLDWHQVDESIYVSYKRYAISYTNYEKVGGEFIYNADDFNRSNPHVAGGGFAMTSSVFTLTKGMQKTRIFIKPHVNAPSDCYLDIEHSESFDFQRRENISVPSIVDRGL